MRGQVPGPGTVTKVRVKSGPNPAPLQISIIRRLFQTNPNNPNEITDAVLHGGQGGARVHADAQRSH